MITNDVREDRAFVAGLDLPGQPADLAELKALVEATGATVVGEALQRPHPDPATFFGKG